MWQDVAMKKGGVKHWKALQYPCPRCNAAPGMSCYSNGFFYPLCLERYQLNPDVNKIRPGILEKTYTPGIRGEASEACKVYHHSKCSGKIKLGHGLGYKICGCLCHKSDNSM